MRTHGGSLKGLLFIDVDRKKPPAGGHIQKCKLEKPSRRSPVPVSLRLNRNAPRPQAGLDHAGCSETYGTLRTRQAQARLAPSGGIF